jgi:hypothetical protein
MDDQALKDYFEFDEDDLAANRNGGYSKKQQQKIAAQYKPVVSEGLRLGVPTAALAFILLIVTIVFFKRLGSDALPIILFMLICAGLGYFGLRSAYNTRKFDPARFIVQKVTGPVRIEHGHNADWLIYIGDEQFDIDEAAASAIKEADIYTFYFDSLAKEVLSVEGLSNKSSTP